MLSRPIEQNGKWGLKQRRVYELDEDGNRIRDQNGEFVFNALFSATVFVTQVRVAFSGKLSFV